ncbi:MULTISPECIES: N-acetylglucosamine-6-phosphate deacetylase [Prevotellaceae]|jgi:N-acetylglucosamine-6-phosphate deacetylase|uniref:N-acetylglucosamine-6-phosphate deacetylase n=1 Tax=Leyella stercorea TaxID=363265 RepID=UPI001F4197E8|nr:MULTISPECIES: N-acetylglucosamine-6-phosphate deacetylase [Prevotellaceae]MCF2645216.1 N-acetylglucosamine-6-phosphate deacetylase [Leyella stercorea]MCI6129235.1 N-acetylglucosamine-6-phosphate deacetylase [Prevotella sp.]MCI6717764.1 N-acetylglucosamine-6-phosphate deacetylase [Prevotella sp.]MCI7371129.1 N-acetylglucosamine-6-phosphate deacetylase [Prevotella sp.]MDD6199492.1 N-acetylglucosamine-6-phosphate deacetylase [Prevotella sp.]
MLKQFVNGRILTPKGWLDGGSIVTDGNRIRCVSNIDLHVVGAEIIDVNGGYIVPGGIDMHTHGGGGRDFIEGCEDAFREAVNAHLKHGTTSIYPTLSSSTIPTIEAACNVCEKLMAEENSPVLGLHIEGSYINPKEAGAQNPVLIKAPVIYEYETLLSKYKCIKRWDEAPELPGSVRFIKTCNMHGVLTALTCTRATYKDVVEAHKAGMTHAAHFYNAMPVVYKEHEFKVPGTVESVYAMQDMTVEVIADGLHVPPVMLKVLHKIKGVEHTALITDSLAYAASEGDVSAEPRVIMEDGVCKLADRSALAGSIATMDTLIRTCIQKANIPMEDTFRMASETPAKIMGVFDRKGSIEEGKDADIIVFDKDINLTYVMQMGNEVVNYL